MDYHVDWDGFRKAEYGVVVRNEQERDDFLKSVRDGCNLAFPDFFVPRVGKPCMILSAANVDIINGDSLAYGYNLDHVVHQGFVNYYMDYHDWISGGSTSSFNEDDFLSLLQ